MIFMIIAIIYTLYSCYLIVKFFLHTCLPIYANHIEHLYRQIIIYAFWKLFNAFPTTIMFYKNQGPFLIAFSIVILIYYVLCYGCLSNYLAQQVVHSTRDYFWIILLIWKLLSTANTNLKLKYIFFH